MTNDIQKGGFTEDMIHPVASIWDPIIPKSENTCEITNWVPDKGYEVLRDSES